LPKIKQKQREELYLLKQEITNRENEIALFQDVATQITAQLNLQQVLKMVSEKAMQLVKADSLLVPVLNKQQTHYEYQATCGKNAKLILGQAFPISTGMCGWVLQHQKALLFGKNYPWEMDVKTIWEEGKESALLVPLISRRKIVGGISALGKQGGGSFTERDMQLLTLFASQVSVAIENAQIFEELEQHQLNLQKLVDERTRELEDTFEQLSKAQELLFKAEKLASLGSLVAGVAHELNTPIGVSLTGITHIQQEFNKIEKKLQDGQLRESDLCEFLDDGNVLAESMRLSLIKAAEQITSFKMVAVDQHSSERRQFNLQKYVDNILLSLHSEIKHRRIDIKNSCDSAIELYSYPGTFSQIITNLFTNSLMHGFPEKQSGSIFLDARRHEQVMTMTYSDNGIGMDEELLKRVFEPFFTTRKGQGGSGLGLHIIYNLVTQKLNGTINCYSKPNRGLTVVIQIPVEKPPS